MASISIRVEVSPEITCKVDDDKIEAWIEARLDDAANTFKTNASGPSPSAPGAWPGLRTGQLVSSIETEATGREGELSSNLDYAGYLTTGTSKMAARKMLGDALDESLSARPELAELAEAVTFEAV